MNDQLLNFARSKLKKGLAQCTESQQRLFKQMYAFKNIKGSIDDAVDNMDVDKIDHDR